MAPRATLKQAIELLKIHQLRRENTAIYQQLQDLRDEVTELHDANENACNELIQAKEDSKGTRILITNAQDQLDNIHSTIKSLKQTERVFKASLADVQTYHKEHIKDNGARYDTLADKIGVLECQSKDISLKQRTGLETLAEKLNGLQQQMARKVNQSQLMALQSSHDNTAVSSTMAHSEALHPSKIHVSVEEDDERLIDAEFSTPGSEHSSEATKPANRGYAIRRMSVHAKIAQLNASSDTAFHNNPRSSKVPDDIDLDETTTETDHTCLDGDQEPCNDSLVMLPYSTEEGDMMINQILSLKQGPSETLLAYLKRGYAIMRHLPKVSENVVIQRMVINLTDGRQKQTFTKWLESTSWSAKDLSNIACLHGINESELLSSVNLNESSTNRMCKDKPNSDVLVAATESPDPAKLPEKQKGIASIHSLRKPIVRRSQRLAEKSQIKPELQPTKGANTKEHEKRSVTRDAEFVTRSRHNEKDPELSKKRKRIDEPNDDERIQADTKVSHNHKKRRPGPLRDMHDPPSKIAQAGVVVSGHVANCRVSRLPRTPNKKILLGEQSKVQPYFRAGSSSPLFAKQANHHIPGLPSIRYSTNTALPSPYNPKPQLVLDLYKRHMRRRQSSPDVDVLLPQPMRQPRQQAQVTQDGTARPTKKKRRLPLPPPPQIPILSTSTEEDRRFDRW